MAELSPEFSQLYARVDRPSIAPKKLLRALLLQVLYSVRSERLLMEQLDYNLLFRWFVGLDMDDPVWDATVFTKNRQRLLAGDIARAFFGADGRSRHSANDRGDRLKRLGPLSGADNRKINARMALRVAHRGYVIQTGRIMLQDAAAELLRSDLVRKTYLGEK